MASITIGIPVYNEADYLLGSLENLAAQTFGDFRALIFDNASTDSTGDVAQEFARKDDRFHYIRQTENKSALPNFHDALRAADTEYFLWRAADDRSDAHFLDVLHGLLEADTSKALAIAKVHSRDLDGANDKVSPAPVFHDNPGWSDKFKTLFNCHPSWIYGLFRREPLLARMDTVVQNYGYPWGFDHLVLFEFIIDGLVTGSNDTNFVQVIKRTRAMRKQLRNNKPDLALMKDLRKKFFTQVRRDVRARVDNPIALMALDAQLWRYTGKRVYKFRRVLQRTVTG